MDIKKAGFRWTSHEEFCLARQVGSECERAQSDTWNVSESRLSDGNANGMLGFSQKSYVYGNESMKNIKMYRKWKDTQGPVFECLEYQPEELGFYLEENRNMWLSVVFSEGCHQDRCAWGALWAVGGAGEGQTREAVRTQTPGVGGQHVEGRCKNACDGGPERLGYRIKSVIQECRTVFYDRKTFFKKSLANANLVSIL